MSGAAISGTDLFDSGPYARLRAALGITSAQQRRATRQALMAAGVAWVPLVLLAAVQGLAWRDRPRESLLLDISAYARYLVALPALVLAERYCLPGLSQIARHFSEAGLITDADRPKYEALLASSRALLDRRAVELGLILVAYAVTLTSGNLVYPADLSTWVAPIREGSRELSLAGWWRLLVSQPLFLLFVATWLWRVLVWSRFLWKVSRLNLQLVPAHPDHVGGLQFVTTSLRAFAPIGFAFGAATAGGMGQAILVDHHAPADYKFGPVGLLVVVALLFAGPMLPFAVPLRRARIAGVFAYGELAAALGRRFERRWLVRSPGIDDEALAAPDFSATTDLYSVAANVGAMRLLLPDRNTLAALLIVTLIPFIPLLLAILPLKDILTYAAKLLL